MAFATITSDSEHTMEQTTSLKAWIVCFSAALFFFYEFIQMNMFNAIDLDIQRAFHIHGTMLGELSSIYFFANVIFLFPAGVLLDRYSTKKIILTAMSLCVAGTVMFALASEFWVAYMARFLTGIGSAFVFVSCIRLATRWFPAHRMALISGLIVTMAMIGGLLAQTPLTILVSNLGWRHALLLDASLGIFIIFIIMTLVQDHPDGKAQEVEFQQIRLQQMGFWHSIGLAYGRLQNWLAALYTCLMNLPLGLLGVVWGSPYLMQAMHFSAKQASYVTSELFIGTIFGGPIMGWISDKIGLRRTPMIIGSIVSLAIVLIIMYIPHLSLSTMIFLFLALGFCTSTQVISYPTVAESNPAILTATAVSIVSITTQGGSSLLQPLFGRLLQSGWDGKVVSHIHIYSALEYRHAMIMIPIGFVVALLLALLMKETHCTASDS